MQAASSTASVDSEWDTCAEQCARAVGLVRFSHSWLSWDKKRFHASVWQSCPRCQVASTPQPTSSSSGSRYAKKGSVDSSTGDLALSLLHKRVTPFIMRRTKEEVLQDLPPKIIQDIYCDLSLIQKYLYEDFAKSQVGDSLLHVPECVFSCRRSMRRKQRSRSLLWNPCSIFDSSAAIHRL